MRTWLHSGFHGHTAVWVAAEDRTFATRLARCGARAPVSSLWIKVIAESMTASTARCVAVSDAPGRVSPCAGSGADSAWFSCSAFIDVKTEPAARSDVGRTTNVRYDCLFFQCGLPERSESPRGGSAHRRSRPAPTRRALRDAVAPSAWAASAALRDRDTQDDEQPRRCTLCRTPAQRFDSACFISTVTIACWYTACVTISCVPSADSQ